MLTPERCPIVIGRTRYIVHSNAVHANNKDFYNPRQLENELYVEAHRSGEYSAEASRVLMEHLGQDASKVLLKTG